MDTLILEDFRCFAERHEVPIRPLTLLVGENSTGKTSFLAAVRAAYDLRLGQSPDFNEEPFHFGSYNQIANYRGGPAQRAESFVIGQKYVTGPIPPWSSQTPGGTFVEVHIDAHFAPVQGQPTFSSLSITSDRRHMQIEGLDQQQQKVSFSIDSEMLFERKISDGRYPPFLGNDLPIFVGSDWPIFIMARSQAMHDMTESDRAEMDVLIGAVRFHNEPRPHAFAPIRTNPQRTYDPVKEGSDPMGSYVPMKLARILSGDGASSDFQGWLNEFGPASGLYSEVSIRRLGRTGDPFQIEVKLPRRGPRRNLVDVGYGVSQALPIIVDAVSSEPRSMLLIQQPEVHLHPRAQAAMGSFFADLVASGRNRLVVETHSDHLVDRVRMDVRDGKIEADDVVILYFEQGERGVDIHPIEIDARGHPVEVPPGYRSFFLDEDRRFFGVGP